MKQTRQRHPYVGKKGKENVLRNAYIEHTKKHERKGGSAKHVDLVPEQMRKA